METRLEADWRVLGFDLRLSTQYHQVRRRFFERWNIRAAFLGVVLGSGAAVGILAEHPRAAVAIALALTVVQGLNLVIGFSRLAWLHGDLYRRFIDLEVQWLKTACTPEALASLTVARRVLEKEEPTPLPYLVRRCQIDVMRRDGNPENEWPVHGFWQRALAQYRV